MPRVQKPSIFDAIQNNDLEQEKTLAEADPSCLSSTAPKKLSEIKGMSPLQVAVTTGWHRKIAWYLLEQGANVNHIEPPEVRKLQAVPFFFDAAEVAIRNARRNELDEKTGEYRFAHDKEDADEAFNFLKAVVEHGADLKLTDYYGNTVITKALYAACCVYPDPRYPGYKHSEEQDEDLLRIFKFLIENGAELQIRPWGYKKDIPEVYEKTIWPLLGPLFE